jgi:protein-S-isoprenylcysteine O-methyltransferase Ste14
LRQLGPRSAALAAPRRTEYNGSVGNKAVTVLYVLALVAVVVSVDILFFRNHFWPRLIVNIGIVLVFAAFGLRFLKR